MPKCHKSHNALISIPRCSVSFWFTLLQTVGLIGLYYCFSIGLTFYQKWFIKGFHFPLSVVICHLVIKFLLSLIFRAALECYTKQERINLSWPVYLEKVCAVGVTSALDIGFSNWSFEFISISLYTMSKSTCIIFILGFAFLFGLEKIKCSLVLVVFFIAVGLFMFTYQSTQFNVTGFAMVMVATMSAGLRWTLAQLIMQKREIGLQNPVDMVYHIQPWMIVGILPLAIIFEGLPLATSSKVFRYEDPNVPLMTALLVFTGAVLAFFMELSEFLLLYFTSSLTLSMAGIFKEVCTLYLAWNLNGDVISTVNFFGLLLSLTGIFIHVSLKSCSSRVEEEKLDVLEMPLLSQQLIADEGDEDVLFEARNMQR